MNTRYIDIHCHGYFKDYAEDREDMMARAKEASISMIHVGTGLETSQQAIALTETYPNNYATIGIHPADLETYSEQEFTKLLEHKRVVAIGECGLDYFHHPETEATQREIFEKQIALAENSRKPLMLHIRDGKNGESAYKDVYDMLKNRDVTGNVHFFAGTKDDARNFLDLGFTCSFTGVITFAREYKELVEYIPDNMIHAETDAPFVAPVPERGKRNEPAFVIHVIEKMAEIKGYSLDKMAEILKENAERVFKI